MVKKNRRLNNPQLDANAVARGLKRRRKDKLNEIFYISLLSGITFLLVFFTVGSFFIREIN